MPDLPAQLYFAYGSNLWLQQMASRCPESYYVGRAVLMDHRWQINSRGFANVIPCSGYNVHGLVYQVSVDDEARLDRNEGVHSGAYTKSYHSVVLHEAVEDLQLPTRYLVQDGRLDKAVNAVRSGSRSHEPEQQGRIRSNVLVYLSSRHSQWGTARDEYIDRMNSGIRDAVTLGIPSDFFENTVRPSIPPRSASRRSQRENQRRRQARQSGHHRGLSDPEEPRRRRRRSSSPQHRTWGSAFQRQGSNLGRSVSTSQRFSGPFSQSTSWTWGWP